MKGGDYKLLRRKELAERGLSSADINKRLHTGELEKVSRGLYAHPDMELDEHATLSEVSAKVPKGVICLISALQFHQIGTQQASSVWLLMRNNSVKPRLQYPSLEIVKSGMDSSFTEGVETHLLNGVSVQITTPARTVVDCFKYRSRVGLVVCLEALKDVCVNTYIKPDEIMKFAKMQRVSNVIQPYLEALVA